VSFVMKIIVFNKSYKILHLEKSAFLFKEQQFSLNVCIFVVLFYSFIFRA
jgi:hypothetical protein